MDGVSYVILGILCKLSDLHNFEIPFTSALGNQASPQFLPTRRQNVCKIYVQVRSHWSSRRGKLRPLIASTVGRNIGC